GGFPGVVPRPGRVLRAPPAGVPPPLIGLRPRVRRRALQMRGDQCWRDLTCLYYHHETQPMPNPLSWYFHHLPRLLHRGEVLGNHFAQLVVPWFLFFPQPIATLAGIVITVTQAWLLLSGNFSWLNVITIALAISAFDDASLRG